MRQKLGACLLAGLVILAASHAAYAASEQAKQKAIDDGLLWLSSQQAADGSWYHGNSGTLAATSAAAMAFI